MWIARGIFSGILGFVRIIVLLALGVVVTANLPILNPRFVTTELDKVNAHALIAAELKSQFLEDEPCYEEMALPQEMQTFDAVASFWYYSER